jgi:hypothetical protein
MSEDLLMKQMFRCCLFEQQDSHTVLEPVLLTCGGNSCKKCLFDSQNDSFKCFNCNSQHCKKDFLGASVNKISESLIKLSLNDLFEDLREKLKFVTENLKGLFKSIYIL